MDVTALLEKLLPTREECSVRALDLTSAHPGHSPMELAKVAIKHARRRAVAVGALTGLAANPFAALPAATVDMVTVLRTEATVAGVIASLLDPESLNDEETFKTDILALLFPSAIYNALQNLGVQAGRQTSKVLVRKYISKKVLKTVIYFSAKYLGLKLTQRAILTKVVPLAGAAAGGTLNWFEVWRLGRRAVKYHRDNEIAVEPESVDE